MKNPAVLRVLPAHVLVVLMVLAGAAQAATEPSADLVKRGEYLSHLGDCIACHTASDGKPMAGGLALETPFGHLYSTNITPDAVTGIGRYTFEQFDRAMRKGVAADGHNLYPAMPFPSYAKTTDEDMKALYAYMQHGVAPVVHANMASGMKWPFNIRWGLKFWNALFLDDGSFKPDPSQSEAWNRGAYIAQSLGHCGSCHTPRGLAFQEKAMDQNGSSGQKYLAGFTVENWHAVNLRDLWTVPETARFLKTGRNSFGAAAGSMTEVISHSTQHFTDADLNALAQYLKSLPTPAGVDKPKMPAAYVQASEVDLYKTRGGLGYVQFCGTCHRRDGRGVGEIFPPLAQNSTVQSKDPISIIHIVLSGGNTAFTQNSPRSFGMPEYSSLDDKEIAEIVTFARTQWGNQGEPVTVAQVRKVRDDLKLKPTQSTQFVTPRFAAMLDKPNADQLIRGMRLMVDTKALLPNNVGNGLNCSSCHLNGGTVANGSPYVGISAFFPSEAPRAGKVIDLEDRFNGCFKRSMNGKPLPKDSLNMKAMVAYSDWMKGNFKKGDKVPGRGTSKVDGKLVGNLDNGKHVYGDQCAVCHGKDGEGFQHTDGSFIVPPLWGDQSFNIGAGMARTYTAAGFVKANMVTGHGQKFPLSQGGLSDQDAVDVSAYFTHMPRPDFPEKVKDWPNGDKPADARY